MSQGDLSWWVIGRGVVVIWGRLIDFSVRSLGEVDHVQAL